MRVTYTRLEARSGEYSATGEATIYRGKVEASGTLYFAEEGVGVPFIVSGPVTKPKAFVSPAAVAGAALRKAGSRIREALRRIFKGGDE
jgi:hypothetical protein